MIPKNDHIPQPLSAFMDDGMVPRLAPGRGGGDEYFKVPELLPTFKSENEEPEAFVDDFNSVLECTEEIEETKTVLFGYKSLKLLCCLNFH